MNDLKTKFGEAFYPVLSPFHQVDGCPLKSVWQTVLDDDTIAIQLEFEPGFLSVAVDPGDDTIDLSLTRSPHEEAVRVSHLDPWAPLIGESFGWGWLGINQQGYLDGVSFSFQSVAPQYSITAVASSLRLAKIHEIATKEHAHRATEASYEPAAKYA